MALKDCINKVKASTKNLDADTREDINEDLLTVNIEYNKYKKELSEDNAIDNAIADVLAPLKAEREKALTALHKKFPGLEPEVVTKLEPVIATEPEVKPTITEKTETGPSVDELAETSRAEFIADEKKEEDIESSTEAATVLLDNSIDPEMSTEGTSNQVNTEATSLLLPINQLMTQANRIGRSVLGKISNFYSSLDNIKTKLVKDYGLTPDEQKGFNFLNLYLNGTKNTTGFNNAFNSLWGKYEVHVNKDGKGRLKWTGKNKTPLKNDIELNPLLQLVDKDTAELPQNVVTAMGVAMVNWLATQGDDTVFNIPADIGMILGKDFKDSIPKDTQTLFTRVGTSRNKSAELIGREILTMLNMKGIKGIDGNYEPKLAMALGQMAISTAIQQGLLTQNSIGKNEYNKHAAEVRDDFVADPKDENKAVNFIRVPVVANKYGQAIPAGPNESLIENFKKHKDFFKKLFNVTTIKVFPNDEPSGKVTNSIRRSVNEVANLLKKGIRYAQQVEHVAKENMFELMEALSKEEFLVMSGWVDPTTRHITDVDSVEGKNRSLEREYDDMKEFMDGRPKGKAFYFEFAVWNVMRMGDTSNTISLQSSKMHRHMFMAKAWEATIDLVNKPEQMEQFKLAVAEALEGFSGIKVDKNTNLNVTRAFDQNIVDSDGNIYDKDLKAAVEAVLNLRKNKKLSGTERKAIVDATELAGENIFSMDGIVALADYVQAKRDGKKEFTTNLPRETDGITNGVISAMIQMAQDTVDIKEFLQRGGIGFKGNPFKSMGEWLSTTGNKDNYETLTLQVEKALDASRQFFMTKPEKNKDYRALTNYGKKNVEVVLNGLEGLVSKLVERSLDETGAAIEKINRDFSKNPLMIFAYGAGLAKIKKQIAENALQEIYNSINDAHNDREALKKIRSNLEAVLGYPLPDILATDFAGENRARLYKLNAEQEKYIKRVISIHFGNSLESSLNSTLGKFADNRAYMNSAIRVMNEVFLVQYQKAHNKAVKEKGTALTRDEINDILVKFRNKGLLPGYKHASSESLIDAIQVTATTREIVPSEKGGKVEQTYNDGTQLPSKRYSLDSNNDLTTTPEGKDGKGFKSNTSNIYTDEFTTDIGVKGYIRGNLSIDANVQAVLMAQFDMLNVHDATMANLLDITGHTSVANRTYYETHDNWNMASSIKESLQTFLAEFETLSKKERDTIDANISYETDQINSSEEFIAKIQEETKLPTGVIERAIQDINNAPAVEQEGTVKEKITAKVQMRLEDANVSDADRIILNNILMQASSTGINKAGIRIGKGEGATTFRTVGEFSGAFNETVATIQSNKNSIIEAMDHIEQFADETSGYHPDTGKQPETMEEHEAVIDTSADEIVQKAKDDTTKGSESINFNARTFNATYSGSTKATTANSIFEDVSKMGDPNIDSPAHKASLRNLLDTIIVPALKSIGNLDTKIREQTGQDPNRTYGVYDPETSIVYIDAARGIIESNVEMSPAEVAVHEWLHAIGAAGIDNTFWAKEELSRLFNLARSATDEDGNKIITWKSFLKRDAAGNVIIHSNMAAEQEAAQKRYDYIFNNTEGQHLHEFFAIGLTNESFSKALSQIKTKSTRNIMEGTVRERIRQLFGRIVDWITERVQKTNGTTVDKALYNLAKNIANINEAKKSEVYNYMHMMSKFNSAAKQKIIDSILIPFSKAIEKQVPKKRRTKAGKIVAGMVTLPVYAHWGSFRTAVNDQMYKLGYTKDNFLYKFISGELMEVSKDNLAWVKILRNSKHTIDQARKEIKDMTGHQILKMFDPENPPTDQELLQLNYILKTDLSSLDPVIYDVPTLLSLFRSDTKTINTKIAKLIRDLKKNHGTESNYYILQAKNLGIYMADGRVGLANTMLNAHNIANLYTTGKTPIGDVNSAEVMIDELATLYSIKNLAPEVKSTIHRRIESEYTREPIENGISFIMKIHKDYKEDSLKRLFNNNKTDVIKGYTKENYDPRIKIKVGTIGQEREFEKLGYVRHGEPLQKERLYVNKGQADLYLYVSKDGLIDRYASAASSLTDQNEKGTDIVNALENAGSRTAFVDGLVDKHKLITRASKFVNRQYHSHGSYYFA